MPPVAEQGRGLAERPITTSASHRHPLRSPRSLAPARRHVPPPSPRAHAPPEGMSGDMPSALTGKDRTMNFISSSQTPQAVNSGFRVDISRGQRIGRVSSEWFSRPNDQRYLSVTELYDAVKMRADRAKTRTVESRAVRVEASRDNAERLSLIVPGQDQPISPTHWSFGQLCSLVGARRHQLTAWLAVASRRACEDAGSGRRTH